MSNLQTVNSRTDRLLFYNIQGGMNMIIVKKFWMMFLVVLLVIAFGLVFLADCTANAQSYDKKVSIAAATPGGMFYIIGAAFSKLLTEKTGLNPSVEATGGGASNVQLIQKNSSTFGISSVADIVPAWEGQLTGAEGVKHQDVRSLFVLFPGVMHGVALARSNIKTIYDVDGKVIGLGPAGSTHDLVWRNLFDFLGIKPSRIYNLSWGDTIDQMRDRKIDAFFLKSSFPNPNISDISSTHDVVVLGIGDEETTKFVEEYPDNSKFTIKANSYKGQSSDIVTAGGWTLMIANKDQDPQLIYDVVKATYENIDILIESWGDARNIQFENIPYLYIPLHLGAYNYYIEQGVTIPDKLIPPEAK